MRGIQLDKMNLELVSNVNFAGGTNLLSHVRFADVPPEQAADAEMHMWLVLGGLPDESAPLHMSAITTAEGEAVVAARVAARHAALGAAAQSVLDFVFMHVHHCRCAQ